MAKVKIPKRVAGVKVPKKLRKQAKKLLKASASPMVTDLALAGLSLAANRMLDSAATAVKPASARPDKPARRKLHGLDLAALVEAAATEGARRFLAGYQAAAPAPEPSPAPKPARKPAAKPAARPAPARRRPGAASEN